MIDRRVHLARGRRVPNTSARCSNTSSLGFVCDIARHTQPRCTCASLSRCFQSLSSMPPRRIEHEGDSDSDLDIFEDFDPSAKSKGKGKGKAIDRGKKDKGKGKAKEVCDSFIAQTQEPCAECSQKQPYAWEASYTRSWDTVQEDEAGSLQGAVEDLIARGRRRRYAHCTLCCASF